MNDRVFTFDPNGANVDVKAVGWLRWILDRRGVEYGHPFKFLGKYDAIQMEAWFGRVIVNARGTDRREAKKFAIPMSSHLEIIDAGGRVAYCFAAVHGADVNRYDGHFIWANELPMPPKARGGDKTKASPIVVPYRPGELVRAKKLKDLWIARGWKAITLARKRGTGDCYFTVPLDYDLFRPLDYFLKELRGEAPPWIGRQGRLFG